MDYGRAVRIARAKSGVTQKEVAARAGLTASYVSMLESGKRRDPSDDVVRRLCEALEIPRVVLTALACSRPERGPSTPADSATAGAFLTWLVS